MEEQKGVVTYRIDPRPSRMSVRVTAAGLLSAFGHNPVIAARNFTGKAEVQADNLESASLHVEIAADSLEVTGDVSEKDRREIERVMREEVLETASYPLITFDSADVKANSTGPSQYRVELRGRMTLHGVTRDQLIPVRVTISGDRLRASGEFSLYQSENGISLVSVAGGALKVKDELKVSFEVVASALKARDTAAA